MLALIVVLVAFIAFVAGLAVGWAVRGTRSWCQDCGNPMACTECPRPVAGRLARAHAAHGFDA